jgi:hypothetical protein
MSIEAKIEHRQFKRVASQAIAMMSDLIGKMPDTGLKQEDSQKICLQQKLHELEMNVNGTTPDDFIVEKESE